jgi:hypothetical protein
MDPRQAAIPEIAIDVSLARRMLSRLTPPVEPLAIERLRSLRLDVTAKR